MDLVVESLFFCVMITVNITILAEGTFKKGLILLTGLLIGEFLLEYAAGIRLYGLPSIPIVFVIIALIYQLPLIRRVLIIISGYLLNGIANYLTIGVSLLWFEVYTYWSASIILLTQILMNLMLLTFFYKHIYLWAIKSRQGINTLLMSVSLLFLVEIVWSGWIVYSNEVNLAEVLYHLTLLIGTVLLLLFLFESYLSQRKQLDTIKKEKEFLQMEIKHFQSLIKDLEQTSQDYRDYRHDQENILFTLVRYVNNKELVHLEKYVKETIIPKLKNAQISDVVMSELVNVYNEELQQLLLVKLSQAQSQGVKVRIYLRAIVEFPDDLIFDMIRVIGNLLDNAIEEAESQEQGWIELSSYHINDYIYLSIQNSIYQNNNNLHNINQYKYTTKETGSGIGLYNVNKIVDRYDQIFLDTVVTDDVFTQTLIIEGNKN